MYTSVNYLLLHVQEHVFSQAFLFMEPRRDDRKTTPGQCTKRSSKSQKKHRMLHGTHGKNTVGHVCFCLFTFSFFFLEAATKPQKNVRCGKIGL